MRKTAATAPPPPMAYPAAAATSAFRSLRGLAVAMYVLLSIAAVVAVIQIPVALHARSVVSDNASGNTVLVVHRVYDATTAGPRSSACSHWCRSRSWCCTSSGCGAPRATSNCSHGSARSSPPEFAIGGWFIPLANLIIPGMQTFDIWKGAGPRLQDDECPRGSGLAVVWWVSFILGRLGGFAAPTLELWHRYRVDSFNTGHTVLVAASVFTAIAAVLAVRVIRGITTRQEAGVQALTAGVADRWDVGGFPTPPPAFPAPGPPAPAAPAPPWSAPPPRSSPEPPAPDDPSGS